MKLDDKTKLFFQEQLGKQVAPVFIKVLDELDARVAALEEAAKSKPEDAHATRSHKVHHAPPATDE